MEKHQHTDLAIATDDIKGIAEREVSSQLGGSDHMPAIISIKDQTQPHKNKLPASWNYKKKKANWEAFREAVDRKTASLELLETNISSSVALFNKAVLEAAKMFIPRGRRRDYQPYWSPELDNLHKALDQAKEKIGSSSTNANVEAHSKVKAQYTRAKTQATRNSWHEKTASLNMEKDMTGLWNLTRALNNDNPSKSKTVIEANNEIITEEESCKCFCRLLPGTKHHSCCPRAHQGGQRRNREHHSVIVW